MIQHILGIDIGGTFTDFVLLHNGNITIYKLPTTPDPSQALLAGVERLGTPDILVHGTTIATNALLERRGAVTALLTTAGFGDILVIGRGNRPSLYDFDVQRAPSPVPADLRLEVSERIACDGTIIHPLDERTVKAHIERLIAANVEAVAICFLHSYCNPIHEQRVAAILSDIRTPNGSPRFFVCASSDVLPEYREYERMSTTVVNAYVATVLDRYLSTIEQQLNQKQTSRQHVPTLHIMASDGGCMTATLARSLAARTTLSGPAGGVVGARAVALQAGFDRIITFDMGGTSTDVALCDQEIPQTTESSVGGLPVRFPAIAIHTVGAGGGSLARMDAGGALRVGPQSAGADPGPACYGKGILPTVTDANLILGRLRANHFLGGQMTLDVERAKRAVATLAQQLGLDIVGTALGIVRVAHAAMERAIRAISVERGKDPRDFTLVAFGGAGPLHAIHLAESLGIERVLLPRYPGVLSAFGMTKAKRTRDYVAFFAQPLATLTPEHVWQQMHHLIEQIHPDICQDFEQTHALCAEWSLDLRYIGQSHEITTPLITWERLQSVAPSLEATAQRFHQLHQQHHGHAMPDHPIETVVLRLKVGEMLDRGERLHATSLPVACISRPTPITFVQAILTINTSNVQQVALYERDSLHYGHIIAGPAIVMQFDSTGIIPPGWEAIVDAWENLIVTHTQLS